MEKYLAVIAIGIGLTTALSAQTVQKERAKEGTRSDSASKRRTFDQFDLSDGIRLEIPPESGVERPGTVEQVDSETYDGVMRLINYAAAVEREYRSSAGQNHDRSHYYSADNVLTRKIGALNRIIELYRTGLFGQQLYNEQNLSILKGNQAIIRDMQSLMANDADAEMFRLLSERYNKNAANSTGSDISRERTVLLIAMLARLNANFSVLKKQLAVAK